VPASLVAGRKYRCAVGIRGGSWIGISCHRRSSLLRRWTSWGSAGVWRVLAEHGVLAWGTVSCTDGDADCLFLLRGTFPLGRPEKEALSRELFRRPVKAHSYRKACVSFCRRPSNQLAPQRGLMKARSLMLLSRQSDALYK